MTGAGRGRSGADQRRSRGDVPNRRGARRSAGAIGEVRDMERGRNAGKLGKTREY